MSENKQSLDVYLDKDMIAKLSLKNDQYHWQYTSIWQKTGFPVSPHLPLEGEISSINIQHFARNLLPEGAGFEALIHNFHLSRMNTFGLVRALGLDTAGALIIVPEAQPLPEEAYFRPIAEKELKERLDHRDEFSLFIWDGKPRLSVSGVQDKINIVLNEENQIGFGEGSLCSTHILKFEKQKLAHLALNEYVSMQLAHHCGLPTANVRLMRYGSHPALLVERFDRKFVSMQEVKRRHIIDGCQALNLSPDYKYERNFGSGRDVKHIRDGVSLKKLFAFAEQCINPVLTKQQILDWALWNVLIYNSDAHGKNISFYVGDKGISLAPFYDLVNVKMYPEFAQELAMGLGDEFDENCISAYQLADFADTCQLPRRLVETRLKFLILKISRALHEGIHLELGINSEEQQYLNRYMEIIQKRCEYLLRESEGILSIEL